MCEETKTAGLNSPAPSAHAAPRQTYAAPWHVQRGQTVAEAWVAEPALRRAYPGPVAALVWTRLWEDEEDTGRQREKTGGLGVGVTIKTECKEINQKMASLCCCIVLSSRVWKTNSQSSQTDQPAVGTINRSIGVTGGHSRHSTDSQPSS